MSTPASSQTKFTDIIVVIHGIGKQDRFATVRSVASRLAGSQTFISGLKDHPIAPQPLGYFHNDVKDLTSVCLIDDAAKLSGALAGIGVAEVFWADIPQDAAQEGRTMEETKAWARTVIARAQDLCARAKSAGGKSIVPPDFHLASEVLDEIVDTVYVLENLTFLAAKAGLFTFDLRQVLEEYLGDVQIVTEFSEYRADIVGRFRRAMDDIYRLQIAENPDLRLHIVAHSEGTVVSFLGLLQAVSGQRPKAPVPDAGVTEAGVVAPRAIPEWLKHVVGYMTIGSPIDKHLLLWPKLWQDFDPAFANTALPEGRVRWRNYYDYGDPVGFKLETARAWLDSKGSKAFEFCGCPKCQHDIGFARYLLPGKAHNDYWDDADVFEHFFKAVVKPAAGPAKIPRTKPTIAVLSPLFPYAFSFVILVAAVFILYKAVSQFTHPERTPLEEIFLLKTLGHTSAEAVSGGELFLHTLGIASLLAGSTLLARLPRLAAGWRWKSVAIGGFLLGCAAYVGLVSEESRKVIGAIFDFEWVSSHGPTLGVLVLALLIGLVALGLSIGGKHRGEERRHWVFRRGMRPLLLCGAIGVLAVVASQVSPHTFGCGARLTEAQKATLTPGQIDVIDNSRFEPDELKQLLATDGDRAQRLANLEEAAPIVAVHPPVWPVLLATAGFLYLWWLAALIFDLAFVWQRYVRNSVANVRLREWSGYARAANAPEACRNPKASRAETPDTRNASASES